MPTGSHHENEALRPYLPRVLTDWVRSGDQSRVRELGGSLAFVDIAGFTKPTERLARQGKVGAEELNDLLDACFTRLIDRASRDGVDLVKWGGDAVLLLFQGDEHGASRVPGGLRDAPRLARDGTSAVLRRLLSRSGCPSASTAECPSSTSWAATTWSSVIAGPAATHTVLMESTASAGEILLELGHRVAPGTAGGRAGRKVDGILLRGSRTSLIRRRSPRRTVRHWTDAACR